MKEKSLFLLAMVVSLTGIAGLFFVSEFSEIEERRIDEISTNDIDGNVKVIGTVTSINDRGKVMTLDVVQPKEIKVLLFKDDKIELKEGNYIEVLGTVNENQEGLEIIGDRIRLID